MFDDNAFEDFVQEKLRCGEIQPRDDNSVETFGRGTTITGRERIYTTVIKYKGFSRT